MSARHDAIWPNALATHRRRAGIWFLGKGLTRSAVRIAAFFPGSELSRATASPASSQSDGLFEAVQTFCIWWGINDRCLGVARRRPMG